MPLMYGIAAFAVLANGLDQTGVDPQIDKQYAIVKSGGQPIPVVAHGDARANGESAAKAGGALLIATQDGIQAPLGQVTTVQSGQVAPPALAGQTGRVDAPPAIVFAGQIPPGAPSIITIPAAPSPFGQRMLTAPPMMAFGGDSLSHLKGMDRLVSVHFNNASATEVMKWLSKQNVNFVANVDKLPKSHVTMNVAHVPLHEALETVAESLGGSWQVKGSTIVFRTSIFGATPFSFSTPPSAGMNSLRREGSQSLNLFGGTNGLSHMNPQQRKAFEKATSDVNGQMKTFKFDFNTMPKMDAKMLEQFKGMTGDVKGFTFNMDPKMLEQFKAMGKDGKTFEFKMDPKMLEQFKAMGKDGKSFAFGSGKDPIGGKGMTFKKIDADKLIKSLTPAQHELMKTQGYLKFSDLTDAQRAMMFDGSIKELPENFTFMFSANGEKVTIKKQ